MTKLSTILQCSYFPTCSGCEIQGNVLSPPILDEIKKYFASHPFSFHTDAVEGWRSRAKLAVRGTSTSPQIGLFKRGTHDVIPIPDCPIHHPSINQAVHTIRNWMIAEQIAPYDEKSHTGFLRYLQCVVERKTGKVQLTLVVNTQMLSTTDLEKLKVLEKQTDWHSIWINFQPDSTNRIFGDEWQLISGEPVIWETLAGTSICFHPACFAQAHLNLFEKILLSIKKSVKPNQKIVEFYAGVGVIGLTLADTLTSLVCTEITPFAQACFELAKKQLPVEQQKKVHSKIAASNEGISLLHDADVIIVDPPRKGLDPTLLQAILENTSATQLVYLSCGFRSFKHDAEKLLAAGWHITKAEGYLLFPGTDHVETLVIFEKL
jgi:23S rRNA (uracil1939-C5)-methyltransferase